MSTDHRTPYCLADLARCVLRKCAEEEQRRPQRSPEAENDQWLAQCGPGEARTLVREASGTRTVRTIDRRPLPQGAA